jgi:hypothetical protein
MEVSMEPRKDMQKNDEQLRREEKQRPRFRPAIERLEERITPSGAFFFIIGQSHGNPYHGHQGGLA